MATYTAEERERILREESRMPAQSDIEAEQVGIYKVPKQSKKQPEKIKTPDFIQGIPSQAYTPERAQQILQEERQQLRDQPSFSQALLRGAGEGLDFVGGLASYIPGFQQLSEFYEPSLKESRERRQMEGEEEPSFAEMLAPGYKATSVPESVLEKSASFLTGSIPFGGITPGRALVGGLGAETGGQAGLGLAQMYPEYLNPELSQAAGELVGGVGADIGLTRMQPRLRSGGEAALQAAERQGVELPAAAVTEGGKYGMGIRKNVEKWSDRINKSMRESFKDIVSDIEPVQAQKGREAAGRSVTDMLNKTYQDTRSNINKQIDIVKNNAPGFSSEATNLLDHVDDMIANFSMAVSPEGNNLSNIAKNIRSKLVEEVKTKKINPQTQIIEDVVEEVPKKLSLSQLVDLKQQASELYSQGSKQLTGSGRLRKTFYEDVKKDLEPLKDYDEGLYNRLQKLYDDYRENFQTFQGKSALRRVMKSETGEQAIRSIRTPEEYEFMQKALLKNPNGKQLLNDWNTAKVESLFRPATAKNVAGGFDHKEFLKIMNDPMTARWLDLVATPSMKKNLSDLNTLSRDLEAGFNKLAQNKGGLTPLEYARAFATTGALTSLFLHGAQNMGNYIVGSAVPKLVGNVFGSDRFQRKVIDAARNFKANRFKRGARLISEAAQIMESSPSVSSEPTDNE